MNKIPPVMVTVYLVLAVLSAISVFTGDDPLNAIFLVLLTMPWSFLISPIVDAINLSGNIVAGVMIAMIGAAINACLLYVLVKWVVGRVKERHNT